MGLCLVVVKRVKTGLSQIPEERSSSFSCVPLPAQLTRRCFPASLSVLLSQRYSAQLHGNHLRLQVPAGAVGATAIPSASCSSWRVGAPRPRVVLGLVVAFALKPRAGLRKLWHPFSLPTSFSRVLQRALGVRRQPTRTNRRAARGGGAIV